MPLNMFNPSSNFFTDCSKEVLLLWNLLSFVFHVCLNSTVLFVPCSLEITCWERMDLLALLCAMFPCVFGIFPYGIMSQA